MLTCIFLLLVISIASVFLFMNHPLAMGLMLLTQTLTISLYVGLALPTFWFSYVLFLVFLGGMLVLFIYVASLASNEMFNLSPSLIMLVAASSLILLGVMLISDPMSFSSPMEYALTDNLTYIMNLYNTFIFKMYHSMNYIITLLMIVYLLLALIIIANIVTVHEGPLRPTT